MTTPEPNAGIEVFYSYSHKDEKLRAQLEAHLSLLQHQGIITGRHDRMIRAGQEWDGVVSSYLNSAAVILLLVSADFLASKYCYDIEVTHALRRHEVGAARVIPVILRPCDWTRAPFAKLQALPRDGKPVTSWRNRDEAYKDIAQGISDVVRDITVRLRQPPPAAGDVINLAQEQKQISRLAPSSALDESVWGTMPLDSKFYITRAADAELDEVLRSGSTVLIKGPRQTGKSSLLARGLARVRQAGARVAFTDLQSFSASTFKSYDIFLLAAANSIAEQLGLPAPLRDEWPEQYASENFRRFISKAVFRQDLSPFFWAIDELDRLFSCDYRSDFLGLLRAMHNYRALDPEWPCITVAISFCTDAHVFIEDVNQSPFNVGQPVLLRDFDPAEVAELNRRYDSPLRDDAEVSRFYELLGGHPFLTRLGLYYMRKQGTNLGVVEALALRDDGIFASHLKHHLLLITRYPELADAVRVVLRGGDGLTYHLFAQLCGAGILAGEGHRAARLRCKLYEAYFRKHL